MPMPYWGIAKAVGPNYNLPVDRERVLIAHENIQRAQALSAHATEHEQHYIKALATLYTDDPDPDYQALAEAYRDAMKELSARYPDDLDAATLYAESIMNLNPWRLWDRDGTPWEGTPEAVRVLESVMQRNPDHIGANHLYIHAVEASGQPERAMAAAMRLADLAPSAGHLVHMPGHIYLRTGDYTAARETNERAARVDEAYIEATSATGVYPLMYYSHNLHFIAVATSGEGRFEDAQRAADRLVRHVAPHLDEMPPLEAFTLVPTTVLLRFERWDDVLKLPAPDPALQSSTTMWHFAQGWRSRELVASRTRNLG